MRVGDGDADHGEAFAGDDLVGDRGREQDGAGGHAAGGEFPDHLVTLVDGDRAEVRVGVDFLGGEVGGRDGLTLLNLVGQHEYVGGLAHRGERGDGADDRDEDERDPDGQQDRAASDPDLRVQIRRFGQVGAVAAGCGVVTAAGFADRLRQGFHRVGPFGVGSCFLCGL